jgi:glucose 1-dehydrogenase
MIQALTIIPFKDGSAEVTELPEPERRPGDILIEGISIGICGTDRDLASGVYGWAVPGGKQRLVLGHESLGRVLEADEASGFKAGDLVVGVVRRADPLPCPACAHGEPDMCSNGNYIEHGIKDLDGFGATRWTVPATEAVLLAPSLENVGVLMEPTTVVAKAWEHIESIGRRAWYEPRRVLVTGAGPIGLLAALLGVNRGLEVHVFDQVHAGRKPALVRELQAQYHTGDAADVIGRVSPDIIIDATGSPEVTVAAMSNITVGGILCLVGFSPFKQEMQVDISSVCRLTVVNNKVIFGVVNANMRHYRAAAEELAKSDLSWLEGMITRRLPLSRALEAFDTVENEVKVIIQLS